MSDIKPRLFTKNKYGIVIAKCCASCAFKCCDNRMRHCSKGHGSVQSSYVCSDWQMSEGLKNAGAGGGKVKDGKYLAHVSKTMIKENEKFTEASYKKQRYTIKTIDEVRTEYIKSKKDIYNNNI